MQIFRFGRGSAVLAILFVALQGSAANAALSKQELKCSATVAKSFGKFQAAIIKETSKCRDADISGDENDPAACDPLPVDAQAKVDKAREKFISSVAKACHGVCSVSDDKVCVSDLTCPPNNATSERCTGKDKPFRVGNLGFPGPYCDAILGHAMTSPDDLGTCLADLMSETTAPIIDELYADIDETTGISEDAGKCLSSISKSVSKTLGKLHEIVVECRDLQRATNSPAIAPYLCLTNDAATIEDVAKEMTKLTESIAKSCTNATITGLPGLCASSGTTPETVADAQACVSDMVREIAVEERGPNHHVYATIGMMSITQPDTAYPFCGDGRVHAVRDEHTGVGEECDGSDAPCGGGACLPPGDLFECTCDSTPRERLVIDGETVDSDAGWTGDSHDASHNDGFGYVSELSNCDCSEFTQATCTGTSADKVCDIFAKMAPRCSDDLLGTESCDERGDNDDFAENADCFVCDANSINAGAHCASGPNADETVCQGKCFVDATGLAVVPQDPCEKQSECGDGATCKGRCDNSVTCERMTEGSPLPLVSAAVPVCISLEFVTDVTGTKNIVTGETEAHYTTRSIVQLGDFATQPCPICAGTCVGGRGESFACSGRCDASDAPCILDEDCVGPGDTSCLETDDDCPATCSGGDAEGSPCQGRCDASNATCLVDTDCVGPGDTTCLLALDGHCNSSNAVCLADDDCVGPGDTSCIVDVANDCPKGTCVTDQRGTCSLQLRCSSGDDEGDLCLPDSITPLGTVSADCGPNSGANLSGTGVQQPFGTMTTELVQHPVGSACSDPAWTNYTCPCPDDGSVIKTKPNGCAGACNAGPNEGEGCAVANGDVGRLTRCVGGSEAGVTCDEDIDCSGGGTCTDNPEQCTAGNLTKIGQPCTTNANCDSAPSSGDGVCEDACPGGLCVPLCYPEGTCTGGTRNGDECATDRDCGGGVCNVSDAEDGLCAAGPLQYRCTGTGYVSLPCSLFDVDTQKGCEAGDDGVLGNSDDIPGAGVCESRPRDCFINNGAAEGGDTLNGGGSPSDINVNAAFCTPKNGNAALDGVSGFGGPSRIRREGSAFVNVLSMP